MNIIIDDEIPESGRSAAMKSADAYDYFTALGKHPRDFRFRKVRLEKEPNGALVTELNRWRNSTFLLTAVQICEEKHPQMLGLSAQNKEIYAKWYALQQANEQAAYTFESIYEKLITIHRARKDDPTWKECLDEAARRIYATWQISLSEDEDEELESAKAEARAREHGSSEAFDADRSSN